MRLGEALIFRLQTGVLFLLLLTSGRLAADSSVLLRSTSSVPPAVSHVNTYSGRVELGIDRAKVSPMVTLVLLMDTLSNDDIAAVKRDLLALYPSLQGHQLTLALIQKGSLLTAGPFASQAVFKNALAEIHASQQPDAPAGSSIEALFNNAAQLGSGWSSLIVVGNVPAWDPPLSEYASSLLFRTFSAQHLRVSWFAPQGKAEALTPFLQATGGALLDKGLRTMRLSVARQWFFQVDWKSPPPPSGFVVFRSQILDEDNNALLEVPEIAASSDASLPSLELYAQLKQKTAEAEALLKQAAQGDQNTQHVLDDLKVALGINPRDPEALAAAAALYERSKDYKAAAGFRKSLTEIRPQDGQGFADLGHLLFLTSDYSGSEAALKHAADLNIHTTELDEDFARDYLADKKDSDALPWLSAALKADQRRQDLWFAQAATAEHLHDSALAIQSYERGLALGGDHPPQLSALLRLYLSDGLSTKALDLARKLGNNIPRDAALREQAAEVFDQAHLRLEALAAWRRVIEVQPNSEHAYSRIAELLLESGDASGAEHAADSGLAITPAAAGLYLIKAKALGKEDRLYALRSTLERGATATRDAGLLAALAQVEETYGQSGAEAYSQLADSLKPGSQDYLQALKRGFFVSLRDDDLKRADSFAARLAAAGHPENKQLLSNSKQKTSGTMVPGGLDALAFAVHAKQQISPDTFFVEYCRTLINTVDELAAPQSPGAAKKYIDSIEQYFRRLDALAALGKSGTDHISITLAINNKGARSHTDKVLAILGLKLRNTKEGVELDLGEKKGQGVRQETASALAIDQVGMQDAFRAGKPFTFEIPFESAAIYPDEKLWRDAFYPGDKRPGAFARTVISSPAMARLYVGLSYMDRPTIAQLLSAVDLKTLADKYSGLVFAFGTAFTIHENHVTVPGGSAASQVWTGLLGTSPEQPGPFFRALLERDHGRLLAFFFTLSHLDRAHQSFFTASLSRASHFYQMFSEVQGPANTEVRDSSFSDFLRSIPLDAEGHVDFPGSAGVWMVAHGHGTSENQITKMSKAAAKASVGQDVEDQILLRLGQVRYRDRSSRHTELDNFLAVAQIDAHRASPLDEESALLLAQHYSEASASYAYFTDLTTLGADDFHQFFAAYDRIRVQSPGEANMRMGELHSLIEWISLLQRRQVITGQQAAHLFHSLTESFAAPQTSAGYARASLVSALAIVKACQSPQKSDSPGEKLRLCLLGSTGNSGTPAATDFQRVLDMQKVPSLDVLVRIDQLLATVQHKPAQAAEIAKLVASLPDAQLPAKTKISGDEKDWITRFSPAAAQKTAAQLEQKAAKPKVKPKDLEKLALQLLGELEPQVLLAIEGPVYARFLRSTDLVVSDDALLVRKHRFYDFALESRENPMNNTSTFRAVSEGLGSYFVGGFGEFASAAGQAAGAVWKTGGLGGKEAAAAQIAAIRSASWDALRESDQRLVALRILAAREWIVESALHESEFQTLSEETLGLLSLGRRAGLLNGIESRDWSKVWHSVTLSDLFSLGGKYLARYKTDLEPSPVTLALREVSAGNDGTRLNTLGAIPYDALGCAHPHLITDAPYEEYARRFFPTESAPRLAEFKLYLSFLADRAGIEPAALSGVAEKLAAEAFRRSEMVDFRDWRALLAAYSSITPDDLKRALAQ